MKSEMLSKHLLSCFCFHIILYLRCFSGQLDYGKWQTSNLNILKNEATQTDTLLEVTPSMEKTIVEPGERCAQITCNFICINGRGSEIANDINAIETKNQNNTKCTRIRELRIYNYHFADSTLRYGFLGSYSDKVEHLYLTNSNITDIAAGTFANGSFVKIYLQDLRLTHMNKDFFRHMSAHFEGLSVMQTSYPMESVSCDFLNLVKYQIRYLIIQAGLSCVRNLTDSDNLLNNLIKVDFSNNNFGQSLVGSVFSKLSLVEDMNLSHSNVEFLPPYIFAELATTLQVLNLSNNRLKTLSTMIFGWHSVSRDTKIYAEGNPWQCSCEFQIEMKRIILYQNTKITCSEPDVYKNMSVFDGAICEQHSADVGDLVYPTKGMFTTPANMHHKENVHPTTRKPISISRPYGNLPLFSTTTTSGSTIESAGKKSDSVECLCRSKPRSSDFLLHNLKWPPMKFDATPEDQLKVRVTLEPTHLPLAVSAADMKTPMLNDSFGLIWFSKVTTKFYKMEINYNEYGMGCYNSISYATTVDDLMPNMAYTFCMVMQGKRTVSPFSCKSIHVPGNLAIQYSAVWLSRDKKTTGLSLLVFGIVLFSFAGILLIYLLLKHKPSLLKGSKRVTTLGGNHNFEEIVVLPRAKSVKSLKEKEENLANRSSQSHFSNVERRRNSGDSVASYESYINTNLYEVIPAYMKFQNIPNLKFSASPTSSARTSIVFDQDKLHPPHLIEDCNYIKPMKTTFNLVDLVDYAEIPYRSKRTSSDPLPEIPADQEPYRGISLEGIVTGYPDVGVIYMLDSQV